MKKRLVFSFLLLELLIAFTLVTLCVLPFLSIPINSLKKEILNLQNIELQRMSDRTFALIKEQIYRKEISWEQITSSKEKKALVKEEQFSLPIQEFSPQKYGMRCYIYSHGKKGQNNEEHRIVTIEVTLNKNQRNKKKPLRYTYQLLVTKTIAKPQNEPVVQTKETSEIYTENN